MSLLLNVRVLSSEGRGCLIGGRGCLLMRHGCLTIIYYIVAVARQGAVGRERGSLEEKIVV
jgi:hypothetical protein